MLDIITSLSLNQRVNIAGVLGFVLSVILAINQLLSNKLRISLESLVIIDAAENVPGSIFVLATLSNKISRPFSLISVCLKDAVNKTVTPVKQTARTYSCRATATKLEVKPVVLSSKFPVRFEAYDTHVLLLELPRRCIDMTLLRPDVPAHNPAAPSRIRRLLHMPYTRPLPLRLVLNTSRGRREAPISVYSVQSWEYLESYAVRKAAYEGNIVFP